MKRDTHKMSKITVISNTTIEPFFSKEIKRFLYDININVIAYEDYMYKSEKIKESDFVLIWLNMEVLFPNLYIKILDEKLAQDDILTSVNAVYSEVIDNIYELGAKKIFIMMQDCTSKMSIVRGNVISKGDLILRMNAELLDNFSNYATMIDINRIIAKTGIDNSYDDINKYRWNAVYSSTLVNMVAAEVYKQYLIYRGETKKCIILDCDNVLWGGIISEDGSEKIELGSIGEGAFYQDFQRFVLSLYYNGITLAIASKNDYDDVINIFDNHSGMLIKKEHISHFEVNWENKAENILKIAKVLNIGLDSIIFVDDSQFEIQLVKKILPEVTTIWFDKNQDIYSQFNCINLSPVVDFNMVKVRNATYKTNYERELLRQKSVDYQEYLKDLGTKIDIHIATELEIRRISELSLRTNQCTNGVRYPFDKAISDFKKNKGEFFAIYVEDRFGSLGLVGAIVICENIIDLFCLSCRALGRGIEEEMLKFILKNYQINKVNFRDTSKNSEIKKQLTKSFLNVQ